MVFGLIILLLFILSILVFNHRQKMIRSPYNYLWLLPALIIIVCAPLSNYVSNRTADRVIKAVAELNMEIIEFQNENSRIPTENEFNEIMKDFRKIKRYIKY